MELFSTSTEKNTTQRTRTAVTVLNCEESSRFIASHCGGNGGVRPRAVLGVHDHIIWFVVTHVWGVERLKAADHRCNPQRRSWRHGRPWDCSVDPLLFLLRYWIFITLTTSDHLGTNGLNGPLPSDVQTAMIHYQHLVTSFCCSGSGE